MWTVEHRRATGFIRRATGIYSSLAAVIVLPVSAGIALLYTFIVVFNKM